MPPLNELIQAAQTFGPKPPPPYTKWRRSMDVRNAKIIEMKERGFTNAQIGSHFGIYPNTVAVVLRNHYGAQTRFNRIMSYKRSLSAYVMKNQGFKLREIGKIVGCGPERARMLARKGERIWKNMVIRLHRDGLAEWEKEFLRGRTISYDIEEYVPTLL